MSINKLECQRVAVGLAHLIETEIDENATLALLLSHVEIQIDEGMPLYTVHLYCENNLLSEVFALAEFLKTTLKTDMIFLGHQRVWCIPDNTDIFYQLLNSVRITVSPTIGG